MDQQFLLWTDDQFIGTARSTREARAIALRQIPGAMVNVCDFDQPPAAQFSIDPGSGARVIGGLGWNNCLRGMLLAATALSDDATAKRAVMEDSLAAIWSQKPVATQEALQAVQEAKDAFKAAKALHIAFCNRYAPLFAPYLGADLFRVSESPPELLSRTS